MFTPLDRQTVLDSLVAAARADDRIVGAALTGSSAVGFEDRWSDIDLALAVADGTDQRQLVSDWTDRLYREHGAVDHTDITHGTTLFRVFLLSSTLQVDIAFWPERQFGAIGPSFRLLFGTAAEPPRLPPPSVQATIGMAWLYALHARSSLARGRVWQAEYMISGIRDQVITLACVRHGVAAVQGRGVDLLPPETTRPFSATLVRSADSAELRRAFSAAVDALLGEIELVDSSLAERLRPVLRELEQFESDL